MLRKLCTMIILVLFASPALAAHCPKDVKVIDAALEKGTELSEEQLAQVKKLRDDGEELHNAGKHGESLEALHEAMDLIGLEHE